MKKFLILVAAAALLPFDLKCKTDLQYELEEAIVLQQVDRVKRLIEIGAGVNKHLYTQNLLYFAFSTSTYVSPEIVLALLEAGANVNAQDTESGKTALHRAVYSMNEELIQLLLQYGADVTIRDNKGNTALHNAVGIYFLKSIFLSLIAAGTDPYAKNNKGESILHYAAQGSLEAVKWLLQGRKFEVNIRDNEGNTPLHFAYQAARFDIIAFLIELGADVKIKNNKGERPLDRFGTPSSLDWNLKGEAAPYGFPSDQI